MARPGGGSDCSKVALQSFHFVRRLPPGLSAMCVADRTFLSDRMGRLYVDIPSTLFRLVSPPFSPVCDARKHVIDGEPSLLVFRPFSPMHGSRNHEIGDEPFLLVFLSLSPMHDSRNLGIGDESSLFESLPLSLMHDFRNREVYGEPPLLAFPLLFPKHDSRNPPPRVSAALAIKCCSESRNRRRVLRLLFPPIAACCDF